MEQQRTTLALVLCFLVWFGWMFFFAPKRPIVPANQGAAGNAPPANQQPGNAPAGNGHTGPAMVEGEFQHPEVGEKIWTAQTPRFDVELTNHGAAVRSLALRGILEKRDGAPLRLLQPFDPAILSLTSIDAAYGSAAAAANWEVLEPLAGELARFRFTYANGLQLTKVFAADEKNSALRIAVTARNLSGAPLQHELEMAGAAGVAHEAMDAMYHYGAHARINDRNSWVLDVDVTPDKLKKEGTFLLPGLGADWGGTANKYFAALLVPGQADPKQRDRLGSWRWTRILDVAKRDEAFAAFRGKQQREPGVEEAAALVEEAKTHVGLAVRMAPVAIDAGQETTQEFTFYAGPRRHEDLDPYDKFGLNRLIDYGWFTAIANLLLTVLGWFYAIFGNYGVAIIALTVTVKACLFPLSKKAQVSAFQMQQVAPKMKAIQEKFENDPQRKQAEVLKLYREHGVNPLMGCLPMFFQIPVLIGLYRGLDLSFDLRQQPFFGWISDLSRPDVLFTLPFQVPFTGTADFHLLPILMTITWVAQSMMTPKSPDPQVQSQQKMMMFMPLIFAFMLYTSASGLILYWFTSTLLGIGEQQYIKRRYLK